MSADSEDDPPPPARSRLLDAGVELLMERGVAGGVDIRLTEAAERAGLTTGGAYKAWKGGQEEFRRELAGEAMRRFPDAEPTLLEAEAKALERAGVPFGRLLRTLATQNISRIVADRTTNAVLFALYGASFIHDDLREEAGRSYQQFTQSYGGLYHHVLDFYGLQIRDGFTMDDLAIALTALTDGYTLRFLIDEQAWQRRLELPDEPDSPSESVYALLVETIFNRMTEPKQADSELPEPGTASG